MKSETIPIIAAALVCLHLSSCASSTEPYRPVQPAVDSALDAEERIQTLLTLSLAPRLTDVAAASGQISFLCRDAAVRENAMAIGRVEILLRCPQIAMTVALADIARIDIARPQHYLTLRDRHGRTLIAVRPRTNLEALALVDALRIARDRQERRSLHPFWPLQVAYTRDRFGSR